MANSPAHSSTEPWLDRLLALAAEASHSPAPAPVHVDCEEPLLQRAYAHCEALTAKYSRSFHLASGLLPLDKRRAARALYAFCRVSDDIVDHPREDAEADLAAWRQRALASEPPCDDLVAVAWADTRSRYGIPAHYAEQLLDGVARDIYQTRYDTFDELVVYCYGVASTVGLMSMHIIGFAGPEAASYAIRLGVALQLTNILRDVGEDWRTGRVYLPRDELASFGLSEADLAAGRVDDRWRALLRFQIARTRQLYADSWPGIALLTPSGRFAIATATGVYRAILDDIEAHDYDVFHRRAHVSTWGKLRRLPGLWWQSRQVGAAVG